jgi:DNA end-binding protein Ku
MRSIWKGHISFGLVNIPVALYTAEQRNKLSLHMLDERDGSRIRYKRVNETTGEEVPNDKIVRGYEYEEGSYVVVDEDELRAATPELTRSIDIDAFVDLRDIDPMFFDKPYFLEPEESGRKGYSLLRETMRDSGKAGIAKLVIRTREYLAAMQPKGDALVITLLRYADELRSTDELALPGKDLDDLGVTKRERDMAATLVDGMAERWDPDRYHDKYREHVMAYIEERVGSGEVSKPPEHGEDSGGPAPINMMEALKQSVEATIGQRKDESSSGTKRKTNSSGKRKPTQKKAG